MRHRVERSLRILTLLRNGNGHDPLSLAQALGVNRRTVYRDIAMLKEMEIPISFDHGQASYVIEGMDERCQADGSPSHLNELLSIATEGKDNVSVEMIIRHLAKLIGEFSRDSQAAEPLQSNLLVESESVRGVSQSTTPRDRGKRPEYSPLGCNETIFCRAKTRQSELGGQRGRVESARASNPVMCDGWYEARSNLQLVVFAIDQGHWVEALDDSEDAADEICTGTSVFPERVEVSKGKVLLYGTGRRGNECQIAIGWIRLLGTKVSESPSAHDN